MTIYENENTWSASPQDKEKVYQTVKPFVPSVQLKYEMAIEDQNFKIRNSPYSYFPSEIMFPRYADKLRHPGSIPVVADCALSVVENVISSRVHPIIFGDVICDLLNLRKGKDEECQDNHIQKKSRKRKRRNQKLNKNKKRWSPTKVCTRSKQSEKKHKHSLAICQKSCSSPLTIKKLNEIELMECTVLISPIDLDEMKKKYKIRMRPSLNVTTRNIAKSEERLNGSIKLKSTSTEIDMQPLPMPAPPVQKSAKAKVNKKKYSLESYGFFVVSKSKQ